MNEKSFRNPERDQLTNYETLSWYPEVFEKNMKEHQFIRGYLKF